jgi:superfamily II RNA helicase
MSTLQVSGDDELTNSAPASKKRPRQKGGDLTSIKRLVSMVMEHDLAPVIVFSFAKRECENYATECANLDINSRQSTPCYSLVLWIRIRQMYRKSL